MKPFNDSLTSLLMAMGVLFGAGVASGASAKPSGSPATPVVDLQVGRGKSVDGRLLLVKDKRCITLDSIELLGYQTIKQVITIPKPGNMPEDCDGARVALAVRGTEAHPIASWVWLPKSRVWQRLETHHLPTRPNGIVYFDFVLPKRALAGDEVELKLESTNPKRPAKPFSIVMDALVLQVQIPVEDPLDLHALAARDHGDSGPRMRIHQFSGKSSGNYEKHIKRMWASWRKGFGESAKTILAQKRNASVAGPGQYPKYHYIKKSAYRNAVK